MDEIWFVNNPDSDHLLNIRNRRLERIDARRGKTTCSWHWPQIDYNQKLSYTFRNFIMGGYVKGQPVLVTAQGSYGPMDLQGSGLLSWAGNSVESMILARYHFGDKNVRSKKEPS